MKHESGRPHERRFHGGPERLRSPERVALLETARVVQLSRDGLQLESVLDVGTGTGIFAEAFARESLQVTGIDPDPDLLGVARRLVPEASFLAGVAEKLPFADGSFDLVFFGHVLHEADDPVTALREARRVARKRVMVLEWPFKEEDRGPPLSHRLAPERVLEVAAKAGFGPVERVALSHMDLYRITLRNEPR
ncbi:MAG: class I SAM-dependent methyltransferase [Spirochaetia bacterium]